MASKNVRQMWAAKLAGGGLAGAKSGAGKLSGLAVGTVVPVSAVRKAAGPAEHPLAGTQRVAFPGRCWASTRPCAAPGWR